VASAKRIVRHLGPGRGETVADLGPRWNNWAREQFCTPAVIARPRTREGMIETILAARERGERVKVAGSGHSFTGIALTDGTMLSLEGLHRILDADPAAGRVRVEAGIVLGALNRLLDERYGLAFANLGDIDRQTLAGSISTGTHGTGIGFENVSAQIEAVETVDAEGNLHRLSEGSDSDGFRAARVGLGALGAIYAVTLRLVPSYTISRLDHPVPLARILDELDDKVDALDHFEFYVFPHTDTALCRESTRTEEPPRPPRPASRYLREVVLENWLSAGFSAMARAVPAAGPTLARLAARNFSNASKVDRSYRVFASERRLKFTEMEYGIPRRHAREAVERVLEVASRPESRCVFPIEVRFVKGDDALLSPSHERDTCYIAVHQDRKLDWPSYFREVEGILAGYEGRPHWGKRHELTAAELAPRYPRWEEFRRVRRRLDPAGAFANEYTDRVLGPVDT
jgi:L-gulono-1,4-lactone dehydrogenase